MFRMHIILEHNSIYQTTILCSWNIILELLKYYVRLLESNVSTLFELLKDYVDSTTEYDDETMISIRLKKRGNFKSDKY